MQLSGGRATYITLTDELLHPATRAAIMDSSISTAILADSAPVVSSPDSPTPLGLPAQPPATGPDGMVGGGWPNHCLTANEVADLFKTNPAANIGLLLGPVSGIIDLECDSPEAEQTFKRLFPNGVATGCYQSKRGRHYLFRWDDRLSDLPSVIKWQGLEFRLGSTGAIQSLIPPSSVDGSKREWVVPPTIIAPLPDAIIDLLLKLPRPKRKPHESAPVDDRRVRRVLAYCEQHGLVHLGVRYDPVTGTAIVDLLCCPFKPPENNKGAPAFLISDRISFHCFHASCSATKHLSDIEQLFGPIYPRIIVGPDLPRIVDESIRVLRSVVYQHDGELTELVSDPEKPPLCKVDNGAPRLRPLSLARLKVLLLEVADYRKVSMVDGERQYVPTTPNNDIVSGILRAASYPGIPPVMAIAHCPILRSDGTIASVSGYDKLTGVLLDLDGDYPDVPSVPEAIELIDDILQDFAYVSPAHKSAFYAALITMVCRPAFAGPAPLFLFDANQSRAGKGLQTDCLTAICEGRRASRCDPPDDNAEMSKIITSLALSGAPYFLIDNCTEKLGGSAIEGAITTGRWSGRILCENRRVDVALPITWLATSNNGRLSSDMVGRTVHCRLEVGEHPELRTDFKHPDLYDYVLKNRRKLAMAAIAIPFHYLKSGAKQAISGWGGFEGWNDLVRASIVWAGLADPDTRESLREQADDDTASLMQLMEAWGTQPMSVKEAITSDNDKMKAFITDLDAKDVSKAIGLLLRDARHRVIGGKRFAKTNKDRPKWFVETVKSAKGNP